MIQVAGAVVALTFCYVGVMFSLCQQWANSPIYSYGFVVPLISAYIAWTNRDKLRAIGREPDYGFGVLLAVAAALMLIAGEIAAVITLRQASLVIAITAAVLLLYGRRALRSLWFPLAYLLLMIPVWDYPIGQLQAPSRILSGVLATNFLQLAGVPALRDGTSIVLPNVTLEILRECSGVNQLIAIIAMALPASYLLLRGTWRRCVMVGISVVIAYLSNGVRIALVGWLAYHGMGDGNLRGVHVAEGLLVSLIGYMVFGLCLYFLSRHNGPLPRDPDSHASHVVSQGWTRGSRRPWLEACVLGLALVAGSFPFLYKTAAVQLPRTLDSLPREINGWTLDTIAGRSTRTLPAIDEALVNAYPSPAGERHFENIDDELVRAYRNADGDRVQLYIGYQRYQQEGKELTGDASRLLNAAASPVNLKSRPELVSINEVVHRDTDGERGLIFWYDLNGRNVANIYVAKAYTFWDSLTRRRSNGAIVMVEWDDRSRAAHGQSREAALRFVADLMRLLPTYLPS